MLHFHVNLFRNKETSPRPSKNYNPLRPLLQISRKKSIKRSISGQVVDFSLPNHNLKRNDSIKRSIDQFANCSNTQQQIMLLKSKNRLSNKFESIARK